MLGRLAAEPWAIRFARRLAAVSPPAHSVAPRFEPLLVAVGGALGSLGRFLVERAFAPFDPQAPTFPWSTLSVNLLGALVLGGVLAFAERRGDRPAWLRPLVGVGFCGSFTTLSTVSVECTSMLAGPHLGLAAAYLAVSFLAGVAMATVGSRLVKRALAAGGGPLGPSGSGTIASAAEAGR